MLLGDKSLPFSIHTPVILMLAACSIKEGYYEV